MVFTLPCYRFHSIQYQISPIHTSLGFIHCHTTAPDHLSITTCTNFSDGQDLKLTVSSCIPIECLDLTTLYSLLNFSSIFYTCCSLNWPLFGHVLFTADLPLLPHLYSLPACSLKKYFKLYIAALHWLWSWTYGKLAVKLSIVRLCEDIKTDSMRILMEVTADLHFSSWCAMSRIRKTFKQKHLSIFASMVM